MTVVTTINSNINICQCTNPVETIGTYNIILDKICTSEMCSDPNAMKITRFLSSTGTPNHFCKCIEGYYQISSLVVECVTVCRTMSF